MRGFPFAFIALLEQPILFKLRREIAYLFYLTPRATPSTAVDSITPTGESTRNPSTPVIANNLFGLTSLNQAPPAHSMSSGC